ncbi:urea carboxylase-associated family protein [Pseudomonas corrugata]|uniref:DUF1989 domain-containing protein n=1 Tax=Pseudomonas corrugata TaxID=47879 RepID=A0A3M3EMN6_9PSED|nr:urea carboxylase-associated family protein [Pseudomonas corrugata]MDU9022793.1 urea carboxylase-associated family protein [Pseudomonas corrugata]MDU9032159.1 urea carboxylase-associated family protein [Pseudomonas corrugata]MDU9037690.1 urea carboxylase-associated family protein [Pseudomonas corrugata]MDU9039015.1 urea carboxylase-associated family protein [Pseudomonas corrugata]QTH11713.1 urea carboxylase-associated family protein [Pseudomonas corrugata]
MNTMTSMTPGERLLLPARQGVALRLKQGQTLQVVNTHGKQVVDTWAFNPGDLQEAMSMEHSRPFWLKLNPREGDSLLTNKRRRILTLVEDTTPGIHDTLVAACDPTRYVQLGVVGHHASCNENLFLALEAIGLLAPDTPSPLNLFMNVPVREDGRIEFAEPVSKPGQYVCLKAEMDAIVVLSACPQDVTAVNGMRPQDVHYRIL